MTTAAVITGCLNGIVLALTPEQRWEATREFKSNFIAERWFIVVGIIAIVILTVLLVVISFKRTRQERKSSDQLFIEYAEKRGLTDRERQILLGIANKAGLKRNESIFTLVSAFDRGAAKIQESLAGRQPNEKDSQLRTDISFLREKLGFKKQPSYSRGSPAKSTKLSSRQIPVGKTLHMTRRKARDPGNVESTIVRNSDTELAVRLASPVRITFGEFWCVHYYFGSSVWEFDTSVVSYDGDILILNHSDDVRFINRRRFIRVPAKEPAFIACFPFEKAAEPQWGPPEFVPAVVTELAGPGLRIESGLKVKEGERVLVVLSLDEKRGGNLTTAKAGILKIVEDIGEVRHIKAIPNGSSIAVELTALSDSDIDELIRITNAASVKAKAGNKNNPAPTEEEHKVNLVTVEGV